MSTTEILPSETKPASPSSLRHLRDSGTTDDLYLDRVEASLAMAEQRLAEAVDAHQEEAVEKQTALAVSVVIPVYNERDTISEIVERIRQVKVHHEIIIVDDFSTDGTREVLLKLAEQADVQVLMHGYNQGKGAALRTGFKMVRGEVVIVQDADLEYDPNDYIQLLEPLEQGEASVVYGSRFIENAEQDPSRIHRFGNWLLTMCSNFFTGQQLTDMETCYKVFRREVLEGIDIQQNRFGFEPEITGKISRKGYPIVEVPISYNARSYDQGKKIGFRDALNALWCILKYRNWSG